MSKVKIQGNASGTGVITLEAPNTNTDRAITLPDSAGELINIAPSTSGNVLTSDGTDWTSAAGGATGIDDVSGVARATSGLLFNSDTAAANVLDDYEEGTWTPGIANMTITGTLSVVGNYVKVGRMVHLHCSFSATTSIAWSTSAIINGFPFSGVGSGALATFGSAILFNNGKHNSLMSANYHPAISITAYDSRCWVGNFVTTGANEKLSLSLTYEANA